MKKTHLLHAELSQLIAAMGHGDAIVIADAGLPVPAGTRCIDLAVTRGVPSFEQVLDAVERDAGRARRTRGQRARHRAHR